MYGLLKKAKFEKIQPKIKDTFPEVFRRIIGKRWARESSEWTLFDEIV